MSEENIKKDQKLEVSTELMDLLEKVNEGIIDGSYLVQKMEDVISRASIVNKDQHLQVIRLLRIDRNPSNLFFYFLLFYQTEVLTVIAKQNASFVKNGQSFINLLDKKFNEKIEGFNGNTERIENAVKDFDKKINRLSEVSTDNINNLNEQVEQAIIRIDEAINKHSDFIEGLSVSIEALKEELSSDGLQRKLDDLRFGNSMTSIGKLTEELNNLGSTLTNMNALESNIQSILKKNEELEKDNAELKSQNETIKDKVTKMETSVKSVEAMLKDLTKNKNTNTVNTTPGKNNQPAKVKRNFWERLQYLFSGD